MSYVTLLANRSAIINSNAGTFNDHASQSGRFLDISNMAYYDLICGFADVGSQYLKKKILSVKAGICIEKGKDADDNYCTSSGATVYGVPTSWSESTVTADAVEKVAGAGYGKTNLSTNRFAQFVTADLLTVAQANDAEATPSNLAYYKQRIANWLNNGVRFGFSPDGVGDPSYVAYAALFYTSRSSTYKPTLTIYFNDDETAALEFSACSPSSGYVDRSQANTFRWATSADKFCIADISAASYTLQWRNGSSGTINSISCGTNTSYDMPANTLPANSTDIQWRMMAVDNYGETVYSDWYQIYTLEPTPEARTISPKNSIESGAESILFQWEHIISTGSEQKGAELQYSVNNTDWLALATVTGSSTEAEVSTENFVAGKVYWRVRTKNQSDVFSTYSDPAQFIYVAEPDTPSVSCQQNPLPLVSWQAEGQQGYQVSIEGVYDSGTLYGTEKTLQIPVYISDGEYIAKVRVQNQFGLWSQWGSCPLTVENNEGGAITLSAADSAGIAVLTWQTADTFDSFIVYRNGKEIAVTENSFFEDNFAAGLNEYQIRGVKAGGNYYLSGTQEVNIKISQAMITLTSMVDWVKLYYSTKILQEVSSNESTTVHLLNIYGTDYPFAEVSTAKRGNLNLSFGLPADDKTTLEKVRAMIGKEACVKVTSGDVIFGIIESMSITKNKFITSCNCQIRRTAGEKQW